MIPHYAPPFGLAAAVGELFGGKTPCFRQLEREAAEQFTVRDAVILPAVRTGIMLLLKTARDGDAVVIGPAYTCLVVHEAVALSGIESCYVEPQADDVLMAAEDILRHARPNCCVVLSEMYGIRYSDAFLEATARVQPKLRILDMAMAIPDAARLEGMAGNDVALFSFGMGKPLYAGGGGLACFQDSALADEIRARRDELLRGNTQSSVLRSDAELLAGVISRSRPLCGPLMAAKAWWRTRQRRSNPSPRIRYQSAAAFVGNDWTRVMTSTQRRLARRNFRRTAASASLRRSQAETYAEKLGAVGIRPRFISHLPQSHFPILVLPSIREPLRQHLRRSGIDTGTQFEFSGMLRRGTYPRAAAVADSILTLPMGEHVSLADVVRIADAVIGGLDAVRPVADTPAMEPIDR